MIESKFYRWWFVVKEVGALWANMSQNVAIVYNLQLIVFVKDV